MNRLFVLTALLWHSATCAAQVSDFVTNIKPQELVQMRAFASATTVASPVQQDIMVLYTPATLAKLGQAGVDLRIQTGMQAAVTAYTNSDVGIVLRIVYKGLSPVGESGTGMVATLTNYRQNAQVIALRNQYGADMVVLLSEDSDWCGYAYLWIIDSNGVRTVDAYAVVNSGCAADNISFEHEIGHMQGLAHDIGTDPTGSGAFPYARGYRVCAADGFFDIMSYACTNGTHPVRVKQFSDPAKFFNSYPMGSTVTPQSDGHRALNDNALTVAAYKATAAVHTPKPPTNLAVH